MTEQYEKDKEIEILNKDVSRLEELLSVSETQYASVEQKVARLQEQLNEANRVIQGYIRSLGGLEMYCPAEIYVRKWGVK